MKQNTKHFPPQGLKVKSFKRPLSPLTHTETCKNLQNAPCSPPISGWRSCLDEKSKIVPMYVFTFQKVKSNEKEPERPQNIRHQVLNLRQIQGLEALLYQYGEKEDDKPSRATTKRSPCRHCA